jgi:lipoate-protein ligase A
LKLYNLGKVPWDESQLIYHALAHRGEEALSLVSPATPYVCIGFHQDLEMEVDTAFCRDNGIPMFRRDLGGGAVYLDGDQLFFQVILRKDNPTVPKKKDVFYRKFLQPIVRVYRNIGIPATYKPVNDVISGARKISGTGAGEIGDCIVFVGNLIVDFNYGMMARILKVPDEKFRDKVHQTLVENLSTIRRELGAEAAASWDEATLNTLMAEAFQDILGPMESAGKSPDLEAEIAELRERMTDEAWLYRKGKPIPERSVKIRAGVNVVHRMHKAPGGLLRAVFEVWEGRFGNVRVSGDFFCYPENAIQRLEGMLEDRTPEEVEGVLDRFYRKFEVDTPGIEKADWLKVFTVE